MKKFSLILTILSTLFILSCSNENYSVDQASMRLPIGAGTNSAAFFTFQNNTDQSVKVLSATSSLDAKIEVHNVLMMDNMMHMQEVEFVEIEKNSTTTFKSGSYHLMIMGIKDKLKADDVVSFTLSLDNTEKVSFEAIVKDLNAMKMDH